MKNEQIMIVEDDNELNRGLCTAFRSEGRNVVCVSTIAEAEQQLALFKPSLILMDINLPDGSGLDLLGMTKKKDPTIPV
ncbi:MAG: response regulator, partial [Clostridiales bacterium]|nr:response regulator [Clostridiales bacterium]